MDYHISKTLGTSFESAVSTVTERLKAEGFGILTDIDVKATLKEKLGQDMNRYRILGACNPKFAHQAIETEPRIGVYMPCSVVVRETGRGTVEVSAMNPHVAMSSVNNPALEDLAHAITSALTRVVSGL